MTEQKPVLVTGGGGFLGSHIAVRYAELGHHVTVVDNFCTGFKSNIQILKDHGIELVEADVSLPWTNWSQNLGKQSWDTVFHFASPASPPLYQKLPFETMWVNTLGLKHALEFADTRNARCIFASTSEVYGDPACSPQPESYFGNVNSFGPRSCYDEAKRMGESIIFNHNLIHKKRHGLVRIFNSYGPRMNPQDGRVIINFLVQALKSKPLTVFGDGKQTRSFCFVDDTVDGILAYAKSHLTEPINIGSEFEFTIQDLALTVCKQFNLDPQNISYQPMPIDDPKQRRPDLTKAKMLLNWKPSTSLNEGLEHMIEWLKNQELA